MIKVKTLYYISVLSSGDIKNSPQLNSSIRPKSNLDSIDMMFPSESMVAKNGVPMAGFACKYRLEVFIRKNF